MKFSLDRLDRLKDSLKSATDRELRKTEDAVFDFHTLKVIQRLFNQKKIRTLENIIATGKEANVFRGKTLDNRNRAVKIYRMNTSTFRKLAPYIEGDPRFQDVDMDTGIEYIHGLKKNTKIYIQCGLLV